MEEKLYEPYNIENFIDINLNAKPTNQVVNRSKFISEDVLNCDDYFKVIQQEYSWKNCKIHALGRTKPCENETLSVTSVDLDIKDGKELTERKSDHNNFKKSQMDNPGSNYSADNSSNYFIYNNVKLEPSITEYSVDQIDSKDFNKYPTIITPTKEGKFPCMYCIKVFAKKQQLKNHIKTHTKEKNFICDVCNKSFIHKQQLTNHTKAHVGEKNFQCEFCDKCFLLKQQLQIHVKTHTGEKNFKCTMCNKTFITKQQLQNHTNSHLGIKPFTCNECHKQFAHKQQLDRHKSNHSLKENHSCSQCEARFLSKTALNLHIKQEH